MPNTIESFYISADYWHVKIACGHLEQQHADAWTVITLITSRMLSTVAFELGDDEKYGATEEQRMSNFPDKNVGFLIRH